MTRMRAMAGDSKIGCILWMLLLVIVVLISWKAIPVKIATSQLYDFMVEQAKWAASQKAETLHKSIYDEFLSLLADKAGKIVIGSQMDFETDLGPLVSRSQVVGVFRRQFGDPSTGPENQLERFLHPLSLLVDRVADRRNGGLHFPHQIDWLDPRRPPEWREDLGPESGGPVGVGSPDRRLGGVFEDGRRGLDAIQTPCSTPGRQAGNLSHTPGA